LVASISDSTLWRWLHEDAIRPRQHRCWIFPRDPDFEIKAGRLLDLYERKWEGRPLRINDFVISADEKTSIQARARIHPTLPPAPHQPMKVEHEYKRHGAWAYLAAWDVHRAKIFGRCEHKSGIAPFDRLVEQVMSQEPTAAPAVSSGLSTTAAVTAANAPSPDLSAATKICDWSTARCMPVG
jgi:hypothetical protein